MAQLASLRTLTGEGHAVVISLPNDFSLLEALRSAVQIRLATAFAHMSGWAYIKEGMVQSSAKTFLLTGFEFNRTEPALLKAWLQLKLSRSDRVSVSISSDASFFHPKVLIVDSPQGAFAIVGSGNLSKGGFESNCECAVYVKDNLYLIGLRQWFDDQFAAGTPLTDKMIKSYEPDYVKAKKKQVALERAQKQTQKRLKEVGAASMVSWNRALDLAESYFRSSDFEQRYTSHQEAARRLLKHLNSPVFDFGRKGWNDFYAEGALGKLDERYREKVFRSGRLRGALRKLTQNPSRAISEVLSHSGSYRIKGFGVNSISKILAASFPDEWPVYNSRVAAALDDFGYKAPRGAGQDGRYVAFRNTMTRFMAACRQRGLNHVNAISLDAFFYDRSKELGF
jgi:HKD family nuclease